MIRRPPRSTRTDTLFPYTPLFRSAAFGPGSVADIIGGRQPDDQQVGAIPLAHPARLAQRRSGCEHCTVGLGRRAEGAEIAALAREAPGSDAAALAAVEREARKSVV